MRFIKTSFLTLSIGLLSACGSESDEPFNGKFTIDDLPGLYELNTSEGSYTIRFSNPDQTNSSGKGVLFNQDFLKLEVASIDIDNTIEVFDWELTTDGKLNLNFPISGRQERLTLTQGKSTSGSILYELDSELDNTFEYSETNIVFTKIQSDEIAEDFISLESLPADSYKLTSGNFTVDYDLLDIPLHPSVPYKLGIRNNNEPIYWTTQYINPNPTPEDTEATQLYGRTLIVRYTVPTIDYSPSIEIISLVSGTAENGQIQYLADNFYNQSESELFPNDAAEFIDNNATWEKVEPVDTSVAEE